MLQILPVELLLALQAKKAAPKSYGRPLPGVPKRIRHLKLVPVETRQTVHEHKHFKGKPRIKFVDVTECTYEDMRIRPYIWPSRS